MTILSIRNYVWPSIWRLAFFEETLDKAETISAVELSRYRNEFADFLRKLPNFKITSFFPYKRTRNDNCKTIIRLIRDGNLLSEHVTLGYILSCYLKIWNDATEIDWDIIHAILELPMNHEEKVWDQYTNPMLREILSHLEDSKDQTHCQRMILDRVQKQYADAGRTIPLEIHCNDVEVGPYPSSASMIWDLIMDASGNAFYSKTDQDRQ